MIRLKTATLCLLSAFLLMSCAEMTPEKHKKEIEEWRADRIERLKAENGWLKIAGLEWLEEGEQTFGSAVSADIRFPEGTMPDVAGRFVREGDRVHMLVDEDVEITVDGEKTDDIELYDGENSLRASHGSVRWTIVQRNELVGVRIFDDNSPHYTGFSGIDSYPVSLDWRVKAEFRPHAEPVEINVLDVLGEVTRQPSSGQLVFEIDGQEHSLDVIDSGDRFFIIFGDETNRTETYPGGRFMYVDRPKTGKHVILDFNYAYNPPCAFNPHTMCPLPPDQNRLATEITAGEKRYTMVSFLD